VRPRIGYRNEATVLLWTCCPGAVVILLSILTLEDLPQRKLPSAQSSCLSPIYSKNQFGTSVATVEAYRTRAQVKEDAVVNTPVDSSGMHFAVIAGLRTETGPERLVIEYPNEESLRDLIAAPSIIAVGFSSREKAVEDSRASVPTAISYQRRPEATARRTIERDQPGFNWAEQRGTRSTLRRMARLLATSYSHVASAAIVIFTSVAPSLR